MDNKKTARTEESSGHGRQATGTAGSVFVGIGASAGSWQTPPRPEQPVIEQLENELRTTRSSLQSAMQDLETAKEELQAANKELQTCKEELQAANDELRSFVDLTALRRAEEAERRYGKLLLLSPDAIMVWRLGGEIETWNRGAAELYGFSAEEAVGKDGRELLHKVFPRPWPEIEAALRDRERWNGDVECGTKDGRTLTVAATLMLFRGTKGEERILQSDRDITQRKAADAERERLIERLRGEEQHKNEFLAILSHELRNPLTPVRNSLFILDRADSGGEQARRARATIERQITLLTRIVEDLLDVTRISRGKLQLKRGPLELGDLVRRTAEDHRSLLTSAGLELEVRMDDRPVWIDGDPARLAQAMGNLLQNAAKFTGRGGHVLVTLDQDPSRAMAVIRVRDDGAGIHPHMLTRLFEPFAQADRTLDRTRGGLGLGLALARGLVRQHGGELQARSDGPGRGTELTIGLPLVEAGSAVATPTPRTARPCACRILVIEDNLDAAESLCEALQLANHEVEVAHSGPEGLKKARELKPDVVLCDIGLPGMDGYEVARTMRSDQELRSVHLVALTGYALPDDLAKAKDAGFDQHLAKPPSMEKLEQVLAALQHGQ